MFAPEETKNRRMRPDEFRDELLLASIFRRPPNYFIKDKPFYPYVRTDEKYCVNFDLNPPK